MQITIEIDENEFQKAMIEIIAKESARTYFRRDEAKGIEKAVKEVIYSQKEELINRCVDRATIELTRKALPKLVEKLSSETKEGML